MKNLRFVKYKIWRYLQIFTSENKIYRAKKTRYLTRMLPWQTSEMTRGNQKLARKRTKKIYQILRCVEKANEIALERAQKGNLLRREKLLN